MTFEQLNYKLSYKDLSAGALLRLCQLESKGCAWFTSNKTHRTGLHLSWRAPESERESARGVAAPIALPSVIRGGGTTCCLHDADAHRFNWLCVQHCVSLCSWQIIWQVKDYSNLLCYSSGISREGSVYHMCRVILASISNLVYLSPSHLVFFLWFKTDLLLTVYSDLDKRGM